MLRDLETAESNASQYRRQLKTVEEANSKLRRELDEGKKAYKRQGRDVSTLLSARTKARLEASAGSKSCGAAASIIAVSYMLFESTKTWVLPEEVMRHEIVQGALTTAVAWLVGRFYVSMHQD